MKIRAKTTFVGTFNMKKDEIKECDDRRVVNDLKKLGLVEDVPEEKESVSDSDTMEQKTMSDEIDFEFDTATFDELRESLEKVAKRYPDYAEKELKKEGREFSKAVRKEALSATDKHTGNLTKGFRLGPVKHINGVILEEFMAEGRKNPHWHLVENGHEIITPFKKNGKKLKNGGKCVGFVPGKRIVSAVLKNWGGKHEERLRRVLERVKDDAGL